MSTSRITTSLRMKMPGYRHVRSAAILLPLLLTACTVEVVEDSGPRPIRPQPMCTMEYDPVCGQRAGQRETFANACQARSSGFRIVGRGECLRERPVQACTREFAPVCARRGGDRQTFPNACTARADGYRIIHPGDCR